VRAAYVLGSQDLRPCRLARLALFCEDGATRLVSRNRIATPGASAQTRLLSMLVMEPGSLIMERKMLLGIKERAERLAHQQRAGAPSQAIA
jgi:hypothetical protein